MTNNFDLEQEIKDLECSDMLKAGLEFYIETNNIKIKSKKDFDKLVNDFKKLNIGE